MDELSNLLASISPDDMEKIKDIAESIMPATKEKTASASNQSPLFNVLKGINETDEKCELIKALKPFLSDEKRRRADEALRLLRLIKILPLIKEINIKDLPI